MNVVNFFQELTSFLLPSQQQRRQIYEDILLNIISDEIRAHACAAMLVTTQN